MCLHPAHLRAHNTSYMLGMKIWKLNFQQRNGNPPVQQHTHTINTRLRLINYDWLMRMHVTPAKLNQFNKNIPDTCTKCMKRLKEHCFTVFGSTERLKYFGKRSELHLTLNSFYLAYIQRNTTRTKLTDG